jgi:hypothetical protein
MRRQWLQGRGDSYFQPFRFCQSVLVGDAAENRQSNDTP